MTRLEKLKELEATLYSAMSDADSKSLASIARQYRETLKDIEEIEGAGNNDDEIAKILSGCDGEPNADIESLSQLSKKRRTDSSKTAKGRGNRSRSVAKRDT